MILSTPVKWAIVLQCLLGFVYLGFGCLLIDAILAPVTNELQAYAASGLPSLPVAMGVAGIGLVGLAATYGMTKGLLWNWWVSLFVDLGSAAALVYQSHQYYTWYRT